MKKHPVKFKFHQLLILIFYPIISCSEISDPTVMFVDSFPEEKHVEVESATWIKSYMIIDMLQIDSFLIVLNQEGKFAFQVYNTNSKLLVKECGKFGRGPNEFIMPRFTRKILKNGEGCFFYVYCAERKLIYTIDLYNLIDGKAYVKEKHQLTTKLHIQTHLINIDSLVIGCSDGTKGQTFAYNIYNKNLNLWDYYPDIPNINDFNEYDLYVLYARSWVYNEELNLLAGAFNTTFNQLDFYTPQGERKKTIELPTTNYRLKAKHFTEESPNYASGIISAYNNIYVSYSPEAYKNKVEYKLGSVINVFDWNGKPQMQYFIKNAMIWMPVVDEVNRKIYAYAPESMESPFVELDL
jgi:hypothetical protein